MSIIATDANMKNKTAQTGLKKPFEDWPICQTQIYFYVWVI